MNVATKKGVEAGANENTAVVLAPRLQRIQQQGVELLDRIRAVTITTADEYASTGEMRVQIRNRLAELDEFIEPIRVAQYDAYQTTLSQRKLVQDPLDAADKILVRIRTTWTDEQERIRQEERERVRKAEEDKLREQQTREAEKLVADGHTEAALELLGEEVHVARKDVEEIVESTTATVTRQDGFSERTTWYAEVVDLMALVKAVAEGRAPIQAIKADEVFLNKQAKAFKGALNVAGVKARSKTSEAVRGGGM